jgi:hypothetical protein
MREMLYRVFAELLDCWRIPERRAAVPDALGTAVYYAVFESMIRALDAHAGRRAFD